MSDKRTHTCLVGTTFDHYAAEIISANDYYPFGVIMPNRTYQNGAYMYGFQGQEYDNEVAGAGNSVFFKYRVHDPRLGRFFSVDPLAPEYPWNSTYAFSENRVLDGRELEGLEWTVATSGSIDSEVKVTTFTVVIQVVNNSTKSSSDFVKNQVLPALEKKTRKIMESNNMDSESKYKINLLFSESIITRELTEDEKNSGFYVVFEDVISDGSGGSIRGEAELGNTAVNQLKVAVNVDGVGISTSEMAETFTHELLHSGGLAHIWDSNVKDINPSFGNATKKEIKSNIMNSDANPIAGNLPNKKRNSISPGQQLSLRRNIEFVNTIKSKPVEEETKPNEETIEPNRE